MPGTVDINAQQDQNQQFTILGVQGTAGITDTAGTSKTVPFSADDNGAMYINILAGQIAPGGFTSINSGTRVVTGAGTPVILGTAACKKISIQAKTTNTGVVSVGDSSARAAESTGAGQALYPGDTYTMEITNLNLIYIDATVAGEGVRYNYFN